MIQEFSMQVKNNIRKEIRGIHTALPGKITKFDASKCLADVTPTMKFKKPDGKKIDFPKITGVPVVFPQVMNQKATIAFPVKEGDSCLLIIAEQSLDYFLYDMETDTDLPFDLTNAICIPGLFSKNNSVMKDACDKEAIILDVKGIRTTIKEDKVQVDVKSDKIEITPDEVKITTPLKVTVTTPKVEINGDVQVNGKITATGDVLANSSISLATHTHAGCQGGSTGMPQ